MNSVFRLLRCAPDPTQGGEQEGNLTDLTGKVKTLRALWMLSRKLKVVAPWFSQGKGEPGTHLGF